MKAFIAYSSKPEQIGIELELTASTIQESFAQTIVETWKQNDIPGYFLTQPILAKIDDCDFLIADITVLNFNVVFEIGYAIGKSKRTFLVVNGLVNGDLNKFNEIGIFDTLGYHVYSSAQELVAKILEVRTTLPLPLLPSNPTGRPSIFLVEPPGKDSYDIKVLSALKKARIVFEKYDPIEKGRLPASYAIQQICRNDALVAHVVGNQRSDSFGHNCRVAFTAGLAMGLDRKLLLLQNQSDPIPLDYRDFVSWAPDPKEISPRIADLALSLYELHQNSEIASSRPTKRTILSQIDFGASIAENEMAKLPMYYLPTAQFSRTLNGEYQTIIGRKGSGKTAFFIQLRNDVRRNPNNLVLDLQPEGYQLIKFKEKALRFLGEGAKEHLLSALWEYVIMLEVANRILRDDRGRHMHNQDLFGAYSALSDFIQKFQSRANLTQEGDFAERLEQVLEDVQARLLKTIDSSVIDNSLTQENITSILHNIDLQYFGRLIAAYMKAKNAVWILFDNLDKGWPAYGITEDDLRLLRSLQNASFKFSKLIRRQEASCYCVLFLRSDVFDNLLEATADKGKVAYCTLDLSNRDILREIIRKRIAASLSQNESELDEVWQQIAVPNVRTTAENSLELLIERSLMRPRCLIDLIRACQSIAVTLGHDRIEEDDIRDGLIEYSLELAKNIGFEIRDVFPSAKDVVYDLLGLGRTFASSVLLARLVEKGADEKTARELQELMLRYGVIGVVDKNGDGKFIYDHRYDIRKLKAVGETSLSSDQMWQINPAFWAALEIDVL